MGLFTEAGPAQRWRRLQARIGMLFLASALAALLTLTLWEPPDPAVAWSRLALGLVLLTCLAILWRRPQRIAGLGLVTVLATAAAILYHAFHQSPPDFPPTLDLLIFVALAATVFNGPGVGDGVTLGLVLALAALACSHPWLRQDDHALRHLSNLGLLLLVQQAVLRGFWRELQDGVAQLERAAQALDQHLEQARAMARTAFAGARDGVEELGRGLLACDPARARSAVAGLRALLEAQRDALPGLEEPPLLGDSRRRLLELRAGTRDRFLLAGALGFLLASLRNSLLPGMPAAFSVVGAASLAGAWWLGRGDRVRGRWAFRTAMLFNQALLLWVALIQFHQAPRGLMVLDDVLISLIFLAALLDSAALSAALLALTLAGLAYLAQRGAAIDAAVTLVSLGFSLMAAWALWRLPGDLLKGLESEGHALELAVRRRRRLLSTLFHDLANPLHTVALLMEGDEDAARAQRLVDRMQRVLEVAASLERAQPRLQPVDLGPLLSELPDLYQERLLGKGLTLDIQCHGLAVLAQPEILRESVLGNLLGNAIKFSPPHGRLRLAALRIGDWVEVSLGDQGPGLPEDALRALAQGLRAPSRPGSLGETGSGYGLGLANEYLAQMGGELSFGPGLTGGTVAVVKLRPA